MQILIALRARCVHLPSYTRSLEKIHSTLVRTKISSLFLETTGTTGSYLSDTAPAVTTTGKKVNLLWAQLSSACGKKLALSFREEVDEKSHRRRRHRRRRRRSSHSAGVRGIRTSQGQNIREKDGPGTGNDRDEVELEEGIRRTNGTAYHS